MTTPKVCPVWVHPSHDLRALPETGPNADGGARREFQGVSEYYGGCTKCGHGYWSETPNKWLSSECTDRSFPYAADIVSDWEQLSFWPDDKPSMNKNFEEGCLLKVTLSGEYSDHLARTIGPGPVRLVRMESETVSLALRVFRDNAPHVSRELLFTMVVSAMRGQLYLAEAVERLNRMRKAAKR